MNGNEFEQIKLSFLERLAPQIVAETEKLIDGNFGVFSDALIINDVRSLLKATTLIHQLATDLVGLEYAEELCNRLHEQIPFRIRVAKQPLSCKELHFVWIGSISIMSLKYLTIWKKANPYYQIKLWFDSECLLASRYNQILHDQRYASAEYKERIINFQNIAYQTLCAAVQEGASFDSALIQFFSQEDANLAHKLKKELHEAGRFYEKLRSNFQLCDVQQYAATIMDVDFYQYYFREIALRGNLACASDILRLHILYHFGGIYVDCDTLPSLEHVFINTEIYVASTT